MDFFGISGYVIAYGFMVGRYRIRIPDLYDYYFNRFLRIYPVFLTLTFLGWVTELAVSGKSPFSIGELPSQLFPIEFSQSYIINGVFWTLGIELQFYLLAPCIIWLIFFSLLQRYWLLFSLCLYLGLLYFQRVATTNYGWSVDSRNVIFCLPHFLCGIIACKATCKIKESKILSYLSVLLVLMLIETTNYLYRYSSPNYWGEIGIVIVDLIIFSLIVAHKSWVRVENYAILILNQLGRLAYSLYAWHGYWLKEVPLLLENFLFLGLITIISAYFTYYWIEKPALEFKRVRSFKN